jgi:hypothetical protein
VLAPFYSWCRHCFHAACRLMIRRSWSMQWHALSTVDVCWKPLTFMVII